ncbi:MAG: transcriptional regulator [Candidatus Eremiobacteraeota bacterium]|nr:transcriptional regulator [Candidatus Eremiobacteraeota bacterium]
MDELLLSKIRLGIIAELLGSEWITFSSLQRATQTTNGNLGAHLAKLIEAGYVSEKKTFVDRKPVTRYTLAPAGRAAFTTHVQEMQSLLTGTENT